ncbi:ribosome biogenesis GTPase Der [Parvularcula sp. LCG005]|uniref:ribosome biogenesis GTPase Der n=1 Tax=Parvularcula sp. LCG005 TaxID=3078805 RepID=UPI002942E25D|nr:ribosome biogenesis GTPase Der [Parvularcula sp. LCG005]WOI52413.1 ribosome biogenesis GTPase Der [Parvularcula sp. LCG005]
MPLRVAIIGRPNVGKSTLFNRLAKRKLALVDDQPGVTRDRREHEVRLGDLDIVLIDTAGLEDASDGSLQARMRLGTEKAIEMADVSLFLVDARAGITSQDLELAQMLRQGGRPVIVCANKTEGRGEEGAYEAYRLGLGDPIAISAEHGEGMSDLYTALIPYAEEADRSVEDDQSLDWDDPLKPLRVAVIGRPNAGKSTLVNKLLNDERLLTGPEAGITRDTISVEWTWKDEDRDWPIKFFDTAGMRKRAKVQDRLEKMSVGDTIRAIRFAEVVVVMMDATIPFEKQDLQIADLALREGRAIILVANKWDLVEDKDAWARSLREQAARLLPQAPDVPIMLVSAQTGRGLDKLMPAITKVYRDWNAKIKTSDLNQWLADATQRHPPPAVAGRRIKIRFITQVNTRPPTFMAHCQRADELPESYKRYLINGIRDAFDVKAVPIRLMLRKGENPYEHKRKTR